MREWPQTTITTDDPGFRALVWSDYRAALNSSGRRESRRRSRLLMLPRMLFNPSLQFALLVRIGQKGPSALLHPVRWLQVVMFSSEIWWFRGEHAIVIGPGVVFPHPMNILVGPGTKIGTGVIIYNSTNIGADRSFETGASADEVAGRAVRISDGAIIYAYAVVQGPYSIGDGAVVGLRVVLDEDVPPGALKTPKAMRAAGEWPGQPARRWPEPEA